MPTRARSLSWAVRVVALVVGVVSCGGNSPTGPPAVPPTPTPTVIQPGPPTANCGGPYGPIQAGRDITFTGLNSSTPNPPIQAYSWDAGDGTPLMSGPTPTHAYQKCRPGTTGCFVRKAFKVTLTVLDKASRSATCETTTEVTALY